MTYNHRFDRIRDAGVDVLRIRATSVLLKVGDINVKHLVRHPVYALSRAFAALGFRAIYLCGSLDYFDILDEVTQGSGFQQFPGAWLTQEMAFSSPSSDIIVDLTNDAISHSFCVDLSRNRRSRCLYPFWGPSSAGISPTPLSEEEFLKLQLSKTEISEIQTSICRIVSGLALQEVLISVSKMDLTAPLEKTVIYDAFQNGPSKIAGISKISEPIQNATADVIGAGALGVHLLESLIPALGPGCTLRIFDPDIIGPENIALQAPYLLKDVGKPKAIVITEKLKEFRCNDVMIKPFVMRYEDRPLNLTKPSIRIACPDSFTARKLVNDSSLEDGVPLAEAGTNPFAAQQRSYLPGQTACLECRISGLSEEAEQEKSMTSCVENRTLPGVNMIAGGILALEALKLVKDTMGSPCTGIITYDARTSQRFGIVDNQPACSHGRYLKEEGFNVK